jgi:hypothetical protein
MDHIDLIVLSTYVFENFKSIGLAGMDSWGQWFDSGLITPQPLQIGGARFYYF